MTAVAAPVGSSHVHGLEQMSIGAVASPLSAVGPNVRLVFGAMEAFQLALVTVACVPRLSVVSVSCRTLLVVASLGMVQPTRQPLSVLVPGLRIVTSAW